MVCLNPIRSLLVRYDLKSMKSSTLSLPLPTFPLLCRYLFQKRKIFAIPFPETRQLIKEQIIDLRLKEDFLLANTHDSLCFFKVDSAQDSLRFP